MSSRTRVMGWTGTTRNQSHQRWAGEEKPAESQPRERASRPNVPNHPESGTSAKKARNRSGEWREASPPEMAATARTRAHGCERDLAAG